MREFIELCFTPPAWIFTLLMIPVSFYWLLSFFGFALGHFFDSAAHAADAALPGDLTHGGFGHGDLGHGDLGGDASHGGGDIAHHAPWGGLSFGEVPRVLSFSLLIFFGWSASLLALFFYPPLEELAAKALWIGAAFSALAFAVAFGATALAVRPINKLMLAGSGPTRGDLVGKLCTVKTQRVDAGFGQAEVDRASSLVQVRDPSGRGFKYGQRAVIYDYDSEREVFLIAPFDEKDLHIVLPAHNDAKAAQTTPSPANSRRGESA